MAATHQCELLCGPAAGDLLEVARLCSTDAVTGHSIVATPVGAPAEITCGYVHQFDATATALSLLRDFPNGANPAGCASGWVNLLVAPLTQNVGIVGVDNNALSGWFLYQRVSDNKLELGDYIFTPYLTAASAYSGWVYWQVRWDVTAQRVHLRLYTLVAGTLTLQEDLSAVWADAPSSMNTLRFGQIAGAPTAGTWQLANLYVLRGGGLWGPLNPTFKAHAINAGPGADNSTSIVPGVTQDGMTAGTDDSTNEWKLNDAIPPDHTNRYLRNMVKSVSFKEQMHGHAASLISGSPAFIAVGVMNKFWGDSTLHQFRSLIKLSATVARGLTGVITNKSAIATASVWAFEYGYFSTNDPSGAAWTSANFDSARPGYGSFMNVTGGEGRIAQCIVYAVYGADAVPVGPSNIRNTVMV